MEKSNSKIIEAVALVTEAIRAEAKGISVAQLVQQLSAKQLSVDETYDGIRRATQRGDVTFDSHMKLVPKKALTT